MKKNKVVFVTGSRAEYGIVKNYLKLLDNDNNINFEIVVTGALLKKEYGKQINIIKNDGFNIAAEIEYPISTKSTADTVKSMSIALNKFGDFFSKNNYDLVIILGDRYEMLSVATAAAMNRQKILHIHGGEATYGNYDEFIRHAITKMSAYHFAVTKEYRNRIIQLGENPRNVYNLGSLGAENCKHIDKKNVIKDIINLQKKSYFVVLMHPETLTKISAQKQVNILLKCINKKIKEYKFVFIGTNADTGSYKIRESYTKYLSKHNKAIYYENLNTDSYHYLLKNSICLIGNSSSGIIEAPSLDIYTINIGDRQRGRIRSKSVLDVSWAETEIDKKIDFVITNKYKKTINPYLLTSNLTKKYYQKTKEILKKNNYVNPKEFYDLNK